MSQLNTTTYYKHQQEDEISPYSNKKHVTNESALIAYRGNQSAGVTLKYLRPKWAIQHKCEIKNLLQNYLKNTHTHTDQTETTAVELSVESYRGSYGPVRLQRFSQRMPTFEKLMQNVGIRY